MIVSVLGTYAIGWYILYFKSQFKVRFGYVPDRMDCLCD